MNYEEKKHRGRTMHHYIFNSVAELAEYIENDPYNIEPHKDWYGCDFDTAIRLAKYGDPELADKLDAKVEGIEKLLDSEGVEIIRDVTGEFFDIGTVLSGEPECWWREDIQPQRDTIRIEANISVMGSVDNDVIMNRGGAIVALCDSLCNAGYGVDLHMYSASQMPNGDHFYVEIGCPTKPLDIDAAAFTTCHPASFRRLVFGLRMKHYNNKYDGGSTTSKSKLDYPESIDFQGIGGGASGKWFKDVESAEKHVVKMIDKYNEASKTGEPIKIYG